MIEKREWRRIDVDIPATATSLITGQALEIKIVNINNQGFCFVSSQDHRPDEKVEVKVDLQGVGPVALLTEIAWSGFFQKDDAYRAGVRVISSDPQEQEKFMKFYNLKLLSLSNKTSDGE